MINSVKWELSQRCNLRCKHCFVGKVEYEHELDLDDSKKMIDILINNGINNIMFSSKEPLIHKNFIDILKYCRFNNISISIVTNGTLFTEELYEELSKCIVKVVSFSLEGITSYSSDVIRGKGVYDKVISAANELKKRSINKKKTIPMALQMSLTSINKNEISEMHDFFMNSPFIAVNIGCIYIIGNAEDNQYIKLSEEEYNDLIYELIRNYASCERPNYELYLKGLNVYEIIYFNSMFDLSLEVIVPNCSAYDGYYSILPDATLCKCVALKGTKNKFNIYSHNILETGKFDPSLRDNDIKEPIKYEFCNKCKFTEECRLCLVIEESEQIDLSKKCEKAYIKLNKIIESIFNGEVLFKLKTMTYLEKKDDSMIVRRYYYTNKKRDTVIKSIFSKTYIEKIYVENKFVLYDETFDRNEIEKDLENLLFNDALVFKNIK